MQVNYKNLGDNYIVLLKTILFYLFRDFNYSSLVVTKAGHFVVKERGLPFFRKRVRKELSDFLIKDVTNQLSNITWGNFGNAAFYQLEIDEILSRANTDELSNARLIIDYLYREMCHIPLRNFFGNIQEEYHLEEPEIVKLVIPTYTDDYPSEQIPETGNGLTYILDPFIIGLRSSIRKRLISVTLSSMLRTIPLKDNFCGLLSTIKHRAFLMSCYSSNSPPQRIPLIYNST